MAVAVKSRVHAEHVHSSILPKPLEEKYSANHGHVKKSVQAQAGYAQTARPITSAAPGTLAALSDIERLARELEGENIHAVMDKTEYFYSKLTDEDRSRFDHFVWLAAGMPPPITFDAQCLIGSDKRIIQSAVVFSTAWRQLCKLHVTLQQSELLSSFSSIGFKGAAHTHIKQGQEAHYCWMDACSVLRGGITKKVEPTIEAVSKETLGDFGAIAREALKRLAHYNLQLLPTSKDRLNMAAFYEVCNGESFPVYRLHAQYAILKKQSPEAAYLLATAVGNRFGCPGKGEKFIESLNMTEQFEGVLDCAHRICIFENGRVYSKKQHGSF